jgi:hypothetical protein
MPGRRRRGAPKRGSFLVVFSQGATASAAAHQARIEEATETTMSKEVTIFWQILKSISESSEWDH